MKKNTTKKGRTKDGRFAPGNTISVNNEGGAPLKFKTPKEFEKACNEYFDWADASPWIKNDVVRGGDNAGMKLEIEMQRPYTLIALCQHIGISRETFYNYERRAEFVDITTLVRDKIANQQIEGAMVGAFNANITARLRGLADKKQHEGGDPNKPIHNEVVTKVVFEDYTK